LPPRTNGSGSITAWTGWPARTAFNLVRYRRIVSAGSTITQQLIKLAQPRRRSFRAKLVEAAPAARLEQVWGKQRIVAEYLNRVDYANLCYDCAEASGFYTRRYK
jgi:penicillin-binding protein 1C